MRPTREGRVAPWRPGLVYKGIGIDPGTDTEDPESPPDWASADLGGAAYIPYLPPPDPGEAEDLNLAFGTDSDGGGNRPVVNPTFANDGDLATGATRTSYFNGGGTDDWYIEADLGTAYEVEDIVIRGGWGNTYENDPSWEIEHSPDGSTWTPAVGTYVWDTIGSPNTATLTLTTSETKRYWRIGQIITFSGLVYPLKVNTWQINGQTGGTDPTNIIWTDAPLSNDEDDATYEDVLEDAIADEVWRVTLADSYLISSVEAILGFDSAGAVTVVLEAGNEADYSDAAVIATMTDTATGSFTADTLTASFTPTAVYQYWQLRLTTTAQDLRVYEVSLFGPVEPTGVHGDLTGREDPDQHPADSITFTPYGTIAATDVQAAIEEVLDEATGGGITVEDEGTPLSTTATTLDFVGGGVSATGSGTTKTITISGGGSGGAGRQLIALPVAALTDSGTSLAPTANDAFWSHINLIGPMKVRGLVFSVATNAAGAFEWGLFDFSSNAAAATKLCGGSAAFGGTGWQMIAATSAPVDVAAGSYALIFKAPSSTVPTIRYNNLGTLDGRIVRKQASYTWDNTPNLTTGWADSAGPFTIRLVGDIDGSTQFP